MSVVGLILVGAGLLVYLAGLLVLSRDRVEGYGYTFGGESFFSGLWLLGSVLAGVGVGFLVHWSLGILAAVVGWFGSIPLRRVLERRYLRGKT